MTARPGSSPGIGPGLGPAPPTSPSDPDAPSPAPAAPSPGPGAFGAPAAPLDILCAGAEHAPRTLATASPPQSVATVREPAINFSRTGAETLTIRSAAHALPQAREARYR